LSWALSGFSNSTVWLIFGAFMFALGYEKTGLGRRIALVLVKAMGRKTLTLGYAVAVADTILAPFTPSNTARSGGTIYPVIRNLPLLYDSKPNDPSMRRVGSYLMWVAIAATCVTSSLFLTALAPNLLAVELVKKTAQVELEWGDWFMAAAPAGILVLVLVPLLAYWLYPPEVKEGAEVSEWAAKELVKLGGITAREITLAVLVVIALVLWIFRADEVNATTAALIVISLMLLTNVVTWDDITKNFAAWNTLAWFATLVALAGGLSQVGFVKWFAQVVASHMSGFTPVNAILLLLLINFFTHYMFASVTAHVTAMIPVLLAVGSTIPDMNMHHLALLLCLQLGIMGIITPYGTGPSPVYYGSGYLPAADYWRLGAIFGIIFFVVFTVLSVPWVLVRG
jgi:L-tartrate/succinate antiporter